MEAGSGQLEGGAGLRHRVGPGRHLWSDGGTRACSGGWGARCRFLFPCSEKANFYAVFNMYKIPPRCDKHRYHYFTIKAGQSK